MICWERDVLVKLNKEGVLFPKGEWSFLNKPPELTFFCFKYHKPRSEL